ncbi:MAG TPA: fused MFS/spermidine synthase, partial [Candidatus Eisenbacteria bacterium]|nr:fused MFS/spermidine synthase [Candidatus Eisenbacteria bacterium]
LTFVFAFEKPRWYSRPVLAGLFAVCLLLWTPRTVILSSHGLANLLLGLGTLFVAAWICHGELVRLRPAPERLTAFYLCIATGGALGGILVGLVAPLVFSTYWEVPLGLFAVLILILISLHRDPSSRLFRGKPARAWGWLAAGTGVAGPLVFMAPLLQQWNYEHHERNFYGVLQIGERSTPSGERMRTLVNGSTLHGTQFLNPDKERVPTTYFGAGSGVSLALEHHPKRDTGAPLRIGVIGLGVGTTASWCRPGDMIRYYEIDPAVLTAAQSSFTFLSKSHAHVETVIGDGRIGLDREPPERTHFDVLVVDAFSGGSIPTHLLTRESFELYRRVIEPDGVIAVHVSNKYLRLVPVVRGSAEAMGVPSALIAQSPDPNTSTEANNWVLVTSNAAFLDAIADRVTPWRSTEDPVLWTDRRTS